MRILVGIGVFLQLGTQPIFSQNLTDGLSRELPKASTGPKRTKAPDSAITIWGETNLKRLDDFAYGPGGDSILAIAVVSSQFDPRFNDGRVQILCWKAPQTEPETLLKFSTEINRLAVSPDGHIAVTRFETRKTDSDRSFQRGMRGWEEFSIAEIYAPESDKPVKTLEFNFRGPQESLAYSGNGKWLAFGPTIYSTVDWQSVWTRSGSPRSPNRWALHPSLDLMAIATPSFVDWRSGTSPTVTLFDLNQKKEVSQAKEALSEPLRQIAIYKEAVDVLAWRKDGSNILMANGRRFVSTPISSPAETAPDSRQTLAMELRQDDITQLGGTADGVWTIVGYAQPDRVIMLNPSANRGFFIEGSTFRVHPNRSEILVHRRIYPSAEGARLTREILLVVDLTKLVD
ncbi:hypothetical protein LOC68_05275 [Blastopirellula sp. JC732]|uniref:WD40 repeat domain-containing protein n=1 Tax=Blastopirellula sediminis TaxID=2894196 RepID=A0A9X1MIN7_9BACT|nr:hypothetical protein [Blastopirellula sediminis]MCC9609425.1 hypothetical protein [Blastopirellula sediminis]MCC9627798.1 hypothetical protein [Blastopirellula sediminis]